MATACDGEDARNAKLPVPFFWYAGAASLLGWNIVLTFTHAFDCDLFNGKLWGGSGWPFWAAFAYAVSQNVGQGALSSRALAERLSVGLRCNVGIVGIAGALIGLLLCKLWWPAGHEDACFAACIALVFTFGIAGAMQQSAVFGLAGAISPKLMQALMVGQGLAGVAAGAVGFAFGGEQIALTTSFIVAAVFLLAGPFLYFGYLRHEPHCKPLLEAARRAGRICSSETPRSQREVPLQPPVDQGPGPPRDERHVAEGEAMCHFEVGEPGSEPKPRGAGRSSLAILRQAAWPQALTVCFVFTATFTVFPGVTAKWSPPDRVPYFIATFQLFDVVGRMAPEVPALRISNGAVVSALSAIRILFVPAFMAVQRADGDWARSIWVEFPLMVLFAFSNGYVSTLSMMLGALQRGVAPDEQAPVGTMMSFFLCFGIFLGSLIALPTQIGISSGASCS